MSKVNEPIMVMDREKGEYIPLNVFITRVLSHFEGKDTAIRFNVDLERYNTKLDFYLEVSTKGR